MKIKCSLLIYNKAISCIALKFYKYIFGVKSNYIVCNLIEQ